MKKSITRRTPSCRADVTTLPFVLVLAALTVLVCGCASGGKASTAVSHYAVEYPSPSYGQMETLDDSIRLETFSIVRAYSTTAMVYRSRPFVYGDDPYHRWKVKPSVMISDLLARDLKAAGLFRSVYSAGDTQTGEYGLSGVIEEIYEREGDSRHHAVLSLNVTLLKANRQDSLNRTVFQKNYHSIQDMEKKDAESFARSVSRAMEMLSKEIIVDVYMAMRRGRSIEKADPADRGLSAR